MTRSADFAHLTPEVLLDVIEDATGIPMTGLTMPLPSYINRVYELQSKAGERLIAKFYRPGRRDTRCMPPEALRSQHFRKDRQHLFRPVSQKGRPRL
jgi:Ser/Thr protein kinase RdoA (MazF antagonist)